jgi:hypothetical protein
MFSPSKSSFGYGADILCHLLSLRSGRKFPIGKIKALYYTGSLKRQQGKAFFMDNLAGKGNGSVCINYILDMPREDSGHRTSRKV